MTGVYEVVMTGAWFVLGLALGYKAWHGLEQLIDRYQDEKARRRWMHRTRPWLVN